MHDANKCWYAAPSEPADGPNPMSGAMACVRFANSWQASTMPVHMWWNQHSGLRLFHRWATNAPMPILR
eukprot:8785900-Lingulodinium_polyedra.AAC.1